MIALAAQQFVTDVANKAKQHSERRSHNKNRSGGNPKVFPPCLHHGTSSQRLCIHQAKLVLSTQDLSAALNEHGVVVRKPEFFR